MSKKKPGFPRAKRQLTNADFGRREASGKPRRTGQRAELQQAAVQAEEGPPGVGRGQVHTR